MNIHLTPEQEEIVNEELRRGQYETAEEVISQALKTLQGKRGSFAAPQKEQQRVRAVREMLEFVEKNRTALRHVSVKQLIHEGHRL